MKNSKLQNPSLRKRKGFTLIELIVVIAILAILAAIAIPTFLGQLDKARASTDAANVKTLKSAANVAIAEIGVGDFTWSVSATGAVTTDNTAYDPKNYITDGPTDPWNKNRTYSVKSTAGVLSCTALGKPS